MGTINGIVSDDLCYCLLTFNKCECVPKSGLKSNHTSGRYLQVLSSQVFSIILSALTRFYCLLLSKTLPGLFE